MSNMPINQEMLNQLLAFLQKCNLETYNNNDYNIVKTVFNYIGKDEFPSIDKLSIEANVSKSSISRFIKMNHFNNYQEFKNLMGPYAKVLFLNQKIGMLLKYGDISLNTIAECIYNERIENLKNTYELFDDEKAKEIIQFIKNSNDITIIGDAHDLEEFYNFQVSLLSSGKPIYLFKVDETKQVTGSYFTNKSLVIFINVKDDFFKYHYLLDSARKSHSKLIYFTQEANHKRFELFDHTYLYGIPHSVNTGYVSLNYIARLLQVMYILSYD